MDTIVDIYIKLIIAVLGFIAPTVTLLFPVFFKGITIIEEKLEIQEAQFEELIKLEIATLDASIEKLKEFGKEGAKTAAKMKNSYKNERIKAQRSNIHVLSKSLYYFQLKEQIKWIFIPLFVALVYIMFFSLIKDNLFNLCELNTIQYVSEVIIMIHLFLLILTIGWLLIKIKYPKFKSGFANWEILNHRKWLSLIILLAIMTLLNWLCLRYNWFNLENKYIKTHLEIYVLCISLLMFFFSIRRLWKIACAVIDAKPMLEENEINRQSKDVPSVKEKIK